MYRGDNMINYSEYVAYVTEKTIEELIGEMNGMDTKKKSG